MASNSNQEPVVALVDVEEEVLANACGCGRDERRHNDRFRFEDNRRRRDRFDFRNSYRFGFEQFGFRNDVRGC
jgi:hypothetical protein